MSNLSHLFLIKNVQANHWQEHPWSTQQNPIVHPSSSAKLCIYNGLILMILAYTNTIQPSAHIHKKKPKNITPPYLKHEVQYLLRNYLDVYHLETVTV